MKKLPLGLLAFFQALGLAIYCSLVGLFFWNANHIFPNMRSFLGPTLLLIIFVLSAIVCTLIFGYNAFIIFWEQKNTKKAIKLLIYTALWLFAIVMAIFLPLAFFK